MSKAEIKIAYIGGGSAAWAQHLMSDLALCPHICGQLALYDIDLPAAQANVRRAEMIFGHAQSRTRFTAVACGEIGPALDGADFVVISIQPGPIELFARDLLIPAKYGILQAVGDTTGPGGISRALRSIPIYQGFAREIMRHCPNAWVINYTNPMTLCTATLLATEPAIKAFGCCHEVFFTQKLLAQLVADHFSVPAPPRQEIKLDIIGVNHFTFATSATWQGHDLFPIIRRHIAKDGFFTDRTATAQGCKDKEDWFTSANLIKFDFFRNFGVMGAAGDRHLVEFVPWYLRDEATLHRWGVLLTPASYRLKRQADTRTAEFQSRPVEKLTPSGEEGVDQILALLGLCDLDTNVNIPNTGQAPGLPLGAVVETNAAFRRDSLKPIVSKPLPPAVQSLVCRVAAVQQAVLSAGLSREKDKAFAAMLNDPLVTISPDKAKIMFDELLQDWPADSGGGQT